MDKPVFRSFLIQTLGCKVNQYESDLLTWELQKKGWHPALLDTPPDLCIINTCAVTGRAATQGRQAIRKMIRTFPDACIVVTGCYAQTGADEIQKIKGVHYIFGQSHKHRIPDLITRPDQPLHPPLPEKPQLFSDDIGQIKTFHKQNIPVERGRTRPVVKVQDGCNAFCTYCIVPYARGRSRSLPAKEVIAQVSQLFAAGYLEIVLTGIHLGHYGKDLTPPASLLSLTRQILNTTAMPRVRLSSIESNEIPPDMVLLVRDDPRICRHFHLPLQSGDNTILRKMNRPYTRNDFIRKVNLIHRHIPECGIGCDVLVGFPGETEAAFKNTLAVIADLPVTYLHVFPFSPRKGTPAAGFPNPVNHGQIKERCQALRELGNRKRMSFYRSLKGRKTEVLAEEASGLRKGYVKGLTPHYVPVHVPGGVDLEKKIIDVVIKEVVSDPEIACLGTPVS